MPKKSNIELENDNQALSSHNAQLLQANQILHKSNLDMMNQIAADKISITGVLLGYANLSTRSDEREYELQKQLDELRIENARKDAKITKLKEQAQQKKLSDEKLLAQVKDTLKHFSEMGTALVVVANQDNKFTENYPSLAKHVELSAKSLKNVAAKRLARAQSNATIADASDSSASSPALPAHNYNFNPFMFDDLNLSDTEIERLLEDEQGQGQDRKKHKMSS